MINGAPSFVPSGSRYGGSTSGQGSRGNYWSSTAIDAYGAYSLYLDSSYVGPAGYSDKYYGFTVRCIAQ